MVDALISVLEVVVCIGGVGLIVTAFVDAREEGSRR